MTGTLLTSHALLTIPPLVPRGRYEEEGISTENILSHFSDVSPTLALLEGLGGPNEGLNYAAQASSRESSVTRNGGPDATPAKRASMVASMSGTPSFIVDTPQVRISPHLATHLASDLDPDLARSLHARHAVLR